jgi:cell division septal protein FtsQ
MSRKSWSGHRVRNRNLGLTNPSSGTARATAPLGSRRERATARQKRRARQHLERVRGESTVRPPPRWSLVVPIAAALALTLGVLFGSPIVAVARSWISGEPVRIDAVSVRGAKRLSVDEIARASGLPRSARLDAVDSAALAASLSEHPWISEADVVALPTGRLLVRVTERVGHAVVASKTREGLLVVDAAGIPFATAEQTDIATLPKLIAGGPLERDVPNAELAKGVALSERVRALGLRPPTEIRLPKANDPEGYAIRLPLWRAQIILGRDDLERALDTLETLANSGHSELVGADTIDLRFAEQAVLRSAPSPKGAAQAAVTRGRAESSKPRPTG